MKKLIACLLIVGLSFGLVACQDRKETPKATEAPVGTDKPVATTAKEAKSDSHVSRDGVDYYEKYGIKDNGDSITLTDTLGAEVTVPKHPKKVANLYNSYLSLWKLMGGDVVAIANQVDEEPVEGVEGVESLGKSSEPNMERLLQIEPDFVLIGPYKDNQPLAEQLNELGIPTLYLQGKSKEDYYRLVRIFSALLEDESLFEKYALDVEDEIQEIIKQVPEGEAPRILLMMATTKSVKVRNMDSANGEMLTDLGAVNIADNAVTGDKAADYSMEEIVKEDPDVIFITEMGSDHKAVEDQRKENLEDNPVWAGLKAVKEGRYHVLPKELFTYKPNQDYAKAYRILAEYLYPDVEFKGGK